MILDHRTYTIPVGLMRDFLALYAAEGRAAQVRHLGEPFGYFTTEVGELTQLVHMWRYEDFADRDRRRAALEADPEWLAYRAKAGKLGHVTRQANCILRAVDFAAMQAAPAPVSAPR